MGEKKFLTGTEKKVERAIIQELLDEAVSAYVCAYIAASRTVHTHVTRQRRTPQPNSLQFQSLQNPSKDVLNYIKFDDCRFPRLKTCEIFSRDAYI